MVLLAWHKEKHTDLWNTIKSSENNPTYYGQLIFDKGAKNTQWGKNSFFYKWFWENWIFVCKRTKLKKKGTLVHCWWECKLM